MNEHTYTLQIIARNAAVANALLASVTSNPANALTFTPEYALPMTREDGPALAIEMPIKAADYEKACAFRDGENPFGIPGETCAEYRATMEIQAGDLTLRRTLRTWAASLGYEVAV